MTWGDFLIINYNILYAISHVLIGSVNRIMGRLQIHNAPNNIQIHVKQHLNKKRIITILNELINTMKKHVELYYKFMWSII